MQAKINSRLTDLTDGELVECLKFASRKKDDSLAKCLDRLQVLSKDMECKLWNDFSYKSFQFSIKRSDDSLYLHGGLIYHGLKEDGSKEENFTVTLNKKDLWQIHT